MGFILNQDPVGQERLRSTPGYRTMAALQKAKLATSIKADRAREAAEQEQIKSNEGSIQHGKLMGSLAEKSAAEGAARDLGSTPEAAADVAVGGEEESAIDTAAGRSKRKRQVFGNAASSGVNI